MDLLKIINVDANINIIGGVCFALFAVLVGTRITTTGIRDYIFIVTIATLGAASVIEHWFINSSIITSCLIGFSIGFLADDVYLNLKATMPQFIKDVINDIMIGVKSKIKSVLGVKDDKC